MVAVASKVNTSKARLFVARADLAVAMRDIRHVGLIDDAAAVEDLVRRVAQENGISAEALLAEFV